MWDSGQFHHENGRGVAVLDVEIGHIGDPMMDLAAWRMRDTVIGLGCFAELYDRYSEITGEPVDLDAIRAQPAHDLDRRRVHALPAPHHVPARASHRAYRRDR